MQRIVEIDKIIKILKKEVKDLQNPSVSEVALDFKNPFHVLISCILSLRTKDQVTRLAAKRLFKLADNPIDMLKLSLPEIEKAIYPVGFYRVKSNNIKNICKDLIGKFKGRVPDNMDELLSLKGVGRKTANLVLTEGFGKPGICVDTHVHRISNRLGYVSTKNPFETEMALRNKLPLKYWIEYNNLLVRWGQNICKPVGPLCGICKIERFCFKVGVEKRKN
ncbi:MAG: endonuclease III [Candidatus Omnitrophica bacterium]|nr:endonuclease III [Candidatus Omnitrophota bacterium]HOX54675.1 endonuclease III [Candidatus Omnitrophota bacterium]